MSNSLVATPFALVQPVVRWGSPFRGKSHAVTGSCRRCLDRTKRVWTFAPVGSLDRSWKVLLGGFVAAGRSSVVTRRSGRLIGPGVAAALALGAIAACDDDSDAVSGSGSVVLEERDVSGFSDIELRGSGDLVVDVGTIESLTIEADDNLLALISTEVRGSSLVIENEQSMSPSTDIVYRIEAIDFDGVSIAGRAEVVAPNVDCDTFSVSVAGSGSFDLDGSCDVLDVDIAGSGNVDADGLLVERADVSITGSGDVVVNASDELDVSITGSGDVVYLGDPATDIDIQGSGVVQRGP
jgi:hypothetical protein